LRLLIEASRPRQWIKNVLVLAAPAAGGVLGHGAVLGRIAVTFVAFSFLASACYLINDVRDVEQDRLHADKCRRPIARGALSARLALRAAALLAFVGVTAGFLVAARVGALGLGYLALTGSYTLLWRGMALLDVAAIAGGFVLRLLAGGAAAPIHVSRSLLLVTVGGAVFIAAGKRLAELRALPAGVAPARRALHGYSTRTLALIASGAASLAFAAYVVWGLRRPDRGTIPWDELSAAPFALWLARYGVLVAAGAGEAPEELVLRDRVLGALTILWLALFGAAVYLHG
jgi:decaprenyl-phosphate phosphoribosyltransferase